MITPSASEHSSSISVSLQIFPPKHTPTRCWHILLTGVKSDTLVSNADVTTLLSRSLACDCATGTLRKGLKLHGIFRRVGDEYVSHPLVAAHLFWHIQNMSQMSILHTEVGRWGHLQSDQQPVSIDKTPSVGTYLYKHSVLAHPASCLCQHTWQDDWCLPPSAELAVSLFPRYPHIKTLLALLWLSVWINKSRIQKKDESRALIGLHVHRPKFKRDADHCALTSLSKRPSAEGDLFSCYSIFPIDEKPFWWYALGTRRKCGKAGGGFDLLSWALRTCDRPPWVPFHCVLRAVPEARCTDVSPLSEHLLGLTTRSWLRWV